MHLRLDLDTRIGAVEPPSTAPRPDGRSTLALLAAASIVIGGALGAWWSSTRRPHDHGDVTAVTSGAIPGRPRAEVRLEAAGAGSARVVVDGAALGVITRGPDGTITGEALGRLAFQTRRLVVRDVELVRDPDVDVELALGVQRLLAAGGVNAPLADPAPRRP